MTTVSAQDVWSHLGLSPPWQEAPKEARQHFTAIVEGVIAVQRLQHGERSRKGVWASPKQRGRPRLDVDAKIEEMAEQRIPTSEIARTLGISRETVQDRNRKRLQGDR